MVLVIGFSLSTMAQNVRCFPATANTDTIITSSSRDTVTKTINVSAGYSALGIQVTTTKTSGTVAGKAYLYSSIDGINYTLTDSSAAFANQTTNTAFFTKLNTPFAFYRVTVQDAIGGSTSTQVNAVRICYTLRKHD